MQKTARMSIGLLTRHSIRNNEMNLEVILTIVAAVFFIMAFEIPDCPAFWNNNMDMQRLLLRAVQIMFCSIIAAILIMAIKVLIMFLKIAT